jgi:hypothetical protein
LRLGCETYAVELNPVAHIIELCTLVYPQKYGKKLADEVEKWGNWVIEKVREEIGDLYPAISINNVIANEAIAEDEIASFLAMTDGTQSLGKTKQSQPMTDGTQSLGKTKQSHNTDEPGDCFPSVAMTENNSVAMTKKQNFASLQRSSATSISPISPKC